MSGILNALTRAGRTAANNIPIPPRNFRPIDSVNLPPGSNVRYRGAAPDRSGGAFERYEPKTTPARMGRLIDKTDDPNDPIHTMFDGYISKGINLGGEDWYNTEELRDWFIDLLGPERGNAEWFEFNELIGATSTGSNVPQNIRAGSFYRAIADPMDRLRVAQMVGQGGITPAEAAAKLGVTVRNMPDDYRYGHVMQGNQAKNVEAQLQGKWDRQTPADLTGAARTKHLQANPKVKGFGNDLSGNRTNIAADKHFMRMLAMADGGLDFLSDKAQLSQENIQALKTAFGPRKMDRYISVRKTGTGQQITTVNLAKAASDGVIKNTGPMSRMPTAWLDTPKATEYAALEKMAQRLAKKYDMTPSQFQASLWMGAGDITGLADESQGTAMELFRRSLDKRAGELGITRQGMLREFIENRSPLAIGGTGILGSMIPRADEPEASQ